MRRQKQATSGQLEFEYPDPKAVIDLRQKVKGINPVARQIGTLHIEGNIIPHPWYTSQSLQYEDGKPNHVAITLLADIVYWYRPRQLRDEFGNEVRVEQKFSSFKLWKRYEDWGEFFGFSRRQVQDAIAFLKNAGLVTVELRTTETDHGRNGNTPFLEPVFEAIKAITYPWDTTDESPLIRWNVIGLCVRTYNIQRVLVQRLQQRQRKILILKRLTLGPIRFSLMLTLMFAKSST